MFRKNRASSTNRSGGSHGRLHGVHRATNSNIRHTILRGRSRCLELDNLRLPKCTNSIRSLHTLAWRTLPVRSEIDAFVRTATNYSIPSEVTMADQTPTYFSRPDWYTALPSAARAFKEQQVSDQFSIVRSVVAGRPPTSTAGSQGAVMPTAFAGEWLRAEFGVMAAAAAAAAAFL